MNALARIVDSVEIELLGRRGLSFAKAAKRVDWFPESQDSVCWRCAGSVGPHETDGDGCASCRSIKLRWDRALRLGRYEGIIKEAILDLKFRGWRKTGLELGSAAADELTSSIQTLGWSTNELCIVPIPMTHRRRIARGVDHTDIIARGIRRGSGIQISRVLGARPRDEQVGLSASARLKNIKGGFFIHESELQRALKTPIRAIVVLDDVRTTGATLGEACRVLKGGIRSLPNAQNCEIWAFSIALAGEQDRVGLG
jgi:predicted amidophosphoribosyltransferase